MKQNRWNFLFPLCHGELNWTLLHFLFLFLKTFKKITVLWTKGSFHTPFHTFSDYRPGSRAQMGICNSHSHWSPPPCKSLRTPLQHFVSVPALDLWSPAKGWRNQVCAGGCPAQNQPHAPGQCRDARDIGVDLHEAVDAPSELVAVGTPLPRQPLPERVCNQGKRLEVDADRPWMQGSNNLLVVSTSPKLNCCLLLGGNSEKDGVKRKQGCFRGVSQKFFLN